MWSLINVPLSIIMEMVHKIIIKVIKFWTLIKNHHIISYDAYMFSRMQIINDRIAQKACFFFVLVLQWQ